jgi:hypothetical protein
MIGTPRTKTETELQWSAIRRAIMARVNYEAQVWRERQLNERLDKAWDEFSGALKDNMLMGPAPEDLDAIGPGRSS